MLICSSFDNFDNFGSNPLCGISSIYEQKAFTQLLSEMEATRKEGKVNLVSFNLLVNSST